MDWRLLIVLLPVLVAAGWAGYNVFTLAFSQFQSFLQKKS
ncbi:photosystem II protein Y [Spirulina sp. CS-785/01]|nr:photosystem II protein Y [Spirulina sp. CS-785/01]MDB9314033.1 photosystem II protein Y [Spirulina sp. CS-785/01]